jgi:hypothetical protein
LTAARRCTVHNRLRLRSTGQSSVSDTVTEMSRHRAARGYSSYLRKTMLALCPPKPNEFEIAT